VDFTYYAGWRLIEERERVAPEGQAFGVERVSRQFTDGSGIDEHLTQDIYALDGTTISQTLYYHEDARGDTVALTDQAGSVVMRLAYSAYGEAYKINTSGALEPLGVEDTELVVYTFQGRQLDSETGLIYFRNRYYDPQQGRFTSRDPLGYVDGLGLHEAFGGRPWRYRDPMGEDAEQQGKLFDKFEEMKKGLDPKAIAELETKFFGGLEIAFHSRLADPASLNHGEVFIGDTRYSFDRSNSIIAGFAQTDSTTVSVLKATDLSPHDKYLILKRAVEIRKLSNSPENRGKGRLFYIFGVWHCNNMALWILNPAIKNYRILVQLGFEGMYVSREVDPSTALLLTSDEAANILKDFAKFKEITKTEWDAGYDEQANIIAQLLTSNSK